MAPKKRRWILQILLLLSFHFGAEGGKFTLERMMKNEMEFMGKANRLAALDKIHKAMPFLDEGDDRYTQELKEARELKDAIVKKRAERRQKKELLSAEAKRREKEGAPKPQAMLPRAVDKCRNLDELLLVMGKFETSTKDMLPLSPQDAARALGRYRQFCSGKSLPSAASLRKMGRQVDHLAALASPGVPSLSFPLIMSAAICVASAPAPVRGEGCAKLAYAVWSYCSSLTRLPPMHPAEAASLCTLLGLAGGTPPRCVWDAILRIRADGLASVNVEPILQLLGRVVFAGVERHISERVLAHMKGAVGNGGGGSGGAGALGILGRLEASLGAKT